MTEEDFKLIISKIKTEFKLIPEKGKLINLDLFSILDKGDKFRINYKWKLDYFDNSIYLISLYNSYRLNIVNPSLEKTLHIKVYKYIYCYLELNIDFPDSIIRPKTFGDTLVNIFKHFDIKLQNKHKFNKQYILGSVDKEVIKKLLSDDFIQVIESVDELYVEVRDNKCLLKYLRPVNYEDTLKLIEVAIEMVKLNNPVT